MKTHQAELKRMREAHSESTQRNKDWQQVSGQSVTAVVMATDEWSIVWSLQWSWQQVSGQSVTTVVMATDEWSIVWSLQWSWQQVSGQSVTTVVMATGEWSIVRSLQWSVSHATMTIHDHSVLALVNMQLQCLRSIGLLEAITPRSVTLLISTAAYLHT